MYPLAGRTIRKDVYIIMIPQFSEDVNKKIDKATNFRKLSSCLGAAYAMQSTPADVKRAGRVMECGTYIAGDIVQVEDKQLLKITHANFCKVRLCPMCQWRRAAKVQTQMLQVFDLLRPQKYRYLLLTLTIPNPDGEHLKDKVDEMHKAWDKLTKRREVKRVLQGFYRSLEVTHNVDKNTYHPHFHAILVVNRNYFTKNYITRDSWLEMWQQSMNDSSITQVDIRPLKTDTEASLMKSLQETCKYICKPAGLLDPGDMDLTAEVVGYVHKALEKRRLIAFGGVFKDARKTLGCTSVEGANADLSDSSTGKGDKLAEVCFIWHSGLSQYRVRSYDSTNGGDST